MRPLSPRGVTETGITERAKENGHVHDPALLSQPISTLSKNDNKEDA